MTDVSQANDGDTLLGSTSSGGTGGSGGASGGASGTTADKFRSQFSSFKSQASDKARDYAGQGVTRATDALDEAAKFLEDTARTVEEKLGPQYGRYGFSAAESVSGFADQLRGKEVDELVEDMRGLVRKSPAVALGAAVGLGFVLARLAKAGASFETGATGGSTGTTGSTGGTGGSTGGMGGTGTGGMGTGGGTTGTGTTGTGPVGSPAGTQAANQSSPITPTFPA